MRQWDRQLLGSEGQRSKSHSAEVRSGDLAGESFSLLRRVGFRRLYLRICWFADTHEMSDVQLGPPLCVSTLHSKGGVRTTSPPGGNNLPDRTPPGYTTMA